MKTDLVPIEQVQLLERNPRRHPERQMIELIKSVEQFGQYRPLVIDEKNQILAGNGLFEAMKRAGQTEVAVHRIEHLTEEQKTKLVLADNKTGDMSSDDFAVVDEMLRELADFEVPGYDPDVLRQLIATAEETTASAQEYGVLDPAQVARLNDRAAPIDEANQGVTVGQLPEPYSGPGSTPAGMPSMGQSATDGTSWGAQDLGVQAERRESLEQDGTLAENPHSCPTCGRPW